MLESTKPSGTPSGKRIMDSQMGTNTRSPESLDIADHALLHPCSALATFSNLFFPMITSKPTSVTSVAIHTAPKPKTPPTGLGAIPTEILMLIFQFVFEACIDLHKVGTSYPKHTTVWLDDNPLSPSLFPYSLASVCIRWLHILSSVAVYWTRQVITVDSHTTPPAVIQTMLQWVGDLSLQVIVTRHPGISGEIDRGEYARVRAVLDLLQPHIHHTWSLTFNVRHSSSLSAFWREQGDAPPLSLLTLMNSRSDIGSTADLPRLLELHPTRNQHDYDISSEAHSLEDTMLSESFFDDALIYGERRHDWFCNISSLTIRGYATSCESRISLHKFISTIQVCGMLERLVLEDIAFISDLRPSCRFHLEVPIVSLRRVTDGAAFASLISQCFGVRLKEDVTIMDCPLDGFTGPNSFQSRVSSTSLILEGMSTSSTAIEALVCFWNGENLSLINCPGVLGSFLRRFPMDETPSGLRCLQITDCENASAEGLLALVKSREIQSVIDSLLPGEADEPCTALAEMHIHGRGSPISSEQAVWFTEHLEAFSWNTTTSDGMQYFWDESTRELIVLPLDH